MSNASDRPDRAATRLVVVAGSGRSGTSTVAGVLNYLGLHVPKPEVPANRTNPRGFFEPKWVVDYQTKLLSRAGVRLSDARPQAFAQAAQVGAEADVQREVRAWLGPVVDEAREIIVKDPRSTWFLPMWRDAAASFGVAPSFLTMLRHPAEVVGSKTTYYANAKNVRVSQATRAAGWVNVMVFGELATRDARRAFVRYDDLLKDWRTAISQAARLLDLSLAQGLPAAGSAEVDGFIDPALHRVQSTWDDIDIPRPLISLCDRVWELANALPELPEGDRSLDAEFDRARADYEELYADAEAIAHSSVSAPKPKGGPARPRGGPQEGAATFRRRAARKARRTVKRFKG